jgi:O-antigen/teichoic acid export membrane protein
MTEVSSSISNIRWVGLSQYGRLAIQLGSVAIFSRLLNPSDFGLMAMASIITSLAGVFQNMGTSDALIQRCNPTEQLFDTVFWFNLAFGLSVGAIVALTSPVVSSIFREPRLAQILLVLALAFPISSAGTTHLAILERGSRFEIIALSEIASSTVGICAAIVAAWANFGVFSLVIQLLITAVVSTCLYWSYSTWRPRWRWEHSELRGIWNFSSNLVGFRSLIYLESNVDNMLIGHYLGSNDLGWYNMGYRIMVLLKSTSFVFSRALFPLYSRRSRDDVGRHYLSTLVILALISSPIVSGLWSLRRPVVEVLLGEKWMTVADVLTWFGPLAWLECFNASTGVVLIAIGKTGILRNLGLFSSSILIVSFVLGLPFGILGIAAMFFFADLIVFNVTFAVVMKVLGLGLRDLILRIWRPVAIACVMAALVAFADSWLVALQAWQRLLMLIPAGAILYGALIFLLARDLLDVLLQALWKMAPGWRSKTH